MPFFFCERMSEPQPKTHKDQKIPDEHSTHQRQGPLHDMEKPHTSPPKDTQETPGTYCPTDIPNAKLVAELMQTLKRVQADFENYIKRTEKENAERASYALAPFIEKLLPVLDSFEMALKHDKNHGLELIYAQFIGVLEKEGLRPISIQGAFNPHYHEVLLISQGPEDKILECLQKGYMFKERVLRHAKIKLMKKQEVFLDQQETSHDPTT